MSKMSKRNIIASTIVGVLTLGSSHAISADPLVNLQKEEAKTHAEAAKSQKRINALYEQTQDLLVEYRQVLDTRRFDVLEIKRCQRILICANKDRSATP